MGIYPTDGRCQGKSDTEAMQKTHSSNAPDAEGGRGSVRQHDIIQHNTLHSTTCDSAIYNSMTHNSAACNSAVQYTVTVQHSTVQHSAEQHSALLGGVASDGAVSLYAAVVVRRSQHNSTITAHTQTPRFGNWQGTGGMRGRAAASKQRCALLGQAWRRGCTRTMVPLVVSIIAERCAWSLRTCTLLCTAVRALCVFDIRCCCLYCYS